MDKMIQKLRVEPPAKFTGKENFEHFLKRFTNYMALTDDNYATIIMAIRGRTKTPFTSTDYTSIDARLGLNSGDTKKLSNALYYVLGSLLSDGPWMILDTTPEMNGFEAIWRLMDRFLHSTQMTAILLLVQIVTTKFNESDFETTFASWENYIMKFEESISKELYPEIKIGLLIAGTSGQLHDHLCLTCGDADDYAEVRNMVLNYVRHKHTTMPSSYSQQYSAPNYRDRDDPMEIGKIGKGGKGNYNQYSNRFCTYCKQSGHDYENCWKRLRAKGGPTSNTPWWTTPKGKGKGKYDYRTKGKGKGRGKGKKGDYKGKYRSKGKVNAIDYQGDDYDEGQAEEGQLHEDWYGDQWQDDYADEWGRGLLGPAR